MKRILFSVIALAFLTADSFSQKVSECALTYRNPNNYGFSIKRGTDFSLNRYSLTMMDGNFNFFPDNDYFNLNFGIGLSYGHEFRKAISEKTRFIYGPELTASCIINNQRRDYNSYRKSVSYRSSAGFFLGLNYLINDNLSFSVQIIPSLIYNYQTSTTMDYGMLFRRSSDSFNFNLTLNNPLFTIAYRMVK